MYKRETCAAAVADIGHLQLLCAWSMADAWVRRGVLRVGGGAAMMSTAIGCCALLWLCQCHAAHVLLCHCGKLLWLCIGVIHACGHLLQASRWF